MLTTKGVITSDHLQRIINKFTSIPTDIDPIFSSAKKYVPEIVTSAAEFEMKPSSVVMGSTFKKEQEEIQFISEPKPIVTTLKR